MSDLAIRCEGIAKQYRIGQRERYRALRDTVTDAVTAPFRRVRAAFRGGNGGPSNVAPTIWALKDVSFEVKSGEVVGIIGRNGAGKSTLLKILSRITKPTLGSAEIYGRVGSLLEVGTGFHPELTGRENVCLNGAILGMSKAEIARKFDEIVAFAELEKFIDTPVKRYSSGMYMRLAFAVAAHLDTEILLVDEVLAVGDVQFQKKCLSKMGQVGRQGRTVLFVSHNIGAIMQLCEKAILLQSGVIKKAGTAVGTARAYMAEVADSSEVDPYVFEGTLASDIQFERVLIASGDRSDTRTVWPTEPVRVSVVGFCRRDIPNFRVTLSLFRDGIRLLTMHDVETPQTLPAGTFRANYEIPARFLRPGEYLIAIGGYRAGVNEWLWAPNVAVFTVTEEWGEGYDPINIGLVNLPHYGTRIIGMSPAEETPIHA